MLENHLSDAVEQEALMNVRWFLDGAQTANCSTQHACKFARAKCQYWVRGLRSGLNRAGFHGGGSEGCGSSQTDPRRSGDGTSGEPWITFHPFASSFHVSNILQGA